MKFRKKPVVIEAVRWMGFNSAEIAAFDPAVQFEGSDSDLVAVIPTLEGNMRASVGDWIIKGVKGEVYPCKPDIFDATYDRVAE